MQILLGTCNPTWISDYLHHFFRLAFGLKSITSQGRVTIRFTPASHSLHLVLLNYPCPKSRVTVC
ncbi:hypothetical protein VFPPC_16714 [Pochonia chlamydosporia 170]|uniref:Uncharacterized protein n=1 Tax=Pochonia chlamydosporia 170 TaxID=1380566 RepID=A0A179F6U9_METCM|nr:hypothetical protein VFPPC_16714 [Pochonia chlamydosporia 170]OAQ61184.1 hypothetical protein VFPPC_16714 [Pochonia chlamydosporia 170]